MEDLQYSPICLSPQSKKITKPIVYFGSVAAASKTIPVFYQDNSYHKPEIEKNFFRQKNKKLQQKISEDSQRIQNWKQAAQEMKLQKFRVGELLGQIQLKQGQWLLMQVAAVLIQKNIRGYLVRKDLDQQVIDFRRYALQKHLIQMTKYGQKCLFHAGQMPDLSGNKIQKSVKRYLFRRKIQRIQRVYHIKLHQKMYIAYALIRRYIYTFRAKKKKNWKLFKIYRVGRLEEIKYRIAVLRVKKQWRKLRLSGPALGQRIKRYKRRLKNQAKAQAIANDRRKYSVVSDSASNVGSKADLQQQQIQQQEELQEIDSQEQRLYYQKQQQRIFKVKMGKISYNIQQSKQTNHQPFLYQKQQQQEKRPATHHTSLTRALASRMNENNPIRPPVRYQSMTNYQPLFDSDGTPLCLPKPKKKPRAKPIIIRKILGQPLYMKQTLASKMNRWDFESLFPPKAQTRSNKQPRPGTTLFNNTKSQIQKQSRPRRVSEPPKPVWKPASNLKRKYLPGIDNNFYQPTAFRVEHDIPHTRPNRLRPLTVGDMSGFQDIVPPQMDVRPTTHYVVELDGYPQSNEVFPNYMNIHVKPRANIMKGFVRNSQ